MKNGRISNEDLQRLGPRLLDQVNEAVAIIDTGFRLAWVNREFCHITGYSADEVLGQPLTILRSGVHSESEYLDMESAVLGQGRWHGEVWRKRKDGSKFPAWLTISAIYDDHGKVEFYVDLFVDIAKIRHERERLEFLVNHDALTGLPNLRLFWDRLENAVRRSERAERTFGLLFIDLDNFKQVNDHQGHRAGNELLMDVARALKACLRESDTIARVGGDEFAVILEEVDLSDRGRRVLDRVRAALKKIWAKSAEDVPVGASLGLALFPHDGANAEALYDAADASMYAEKYGNSGRPAS